MKEVTKEVEWFISTLQREFNVQVSLESIAVEATELGMDEVDAAFMPSEVMDVVPETLLYELMIGEDAEGNEWLGVIGFHVNAPDWSIQMILKNGQIKFRKTFPSPSITRDITH